MCIRDRSKLLSGAVSHFFCDDVGLTSCIHQHEALQRSTVHGELRRNRIVLVHDQFAACALAQFQRNVAAHAQQGQFAAAGQRCGLLASARVDQRPVLAGPRSSCAPAASSNATRCNPSWPLSLIHI